LGFGESAHAGQKGHRDQRCGCNRSVRLVHGPLAKIGRPGPGSCPGPRNPSS
jgi:hypothetical protein